MKYQLIYVYIDYLSKKFGVYALLCHLMYYFSFAKP